MEKLTFNKHEVNKYLASIPQTKGFIEGLESAENWVVDSEPSVMMAIEKWAANLTDASVKILSQRCGSLLVILGFMSARNCFYLLSKLREREPAITTQLANKAHLELDSDTIVGRASIVFVDRMQASALSETLNVFLDSERLTLVTHIINQVKEKYGDFHAA